MKRVTAILAFIMLLGMIIMTGCNVKEVSSAQATTPTPTVTPTPTPKPTPVISTIKPTATINITLEQDTLYDEKKYSIVLPKGASLVDMTDGYVWSANFNDSYVFVGILYDENTNTKYFTNSEANLKKYISEYTASYPINFDVGYKRTTVNCKDAIVIEGKYTDSEGTIYLYFIDNTSSGSVRLDIVKGVYTTGSEFEEEGNTFINEVLNNIKVK